MSTECSEFSSLRAGEVFQIGPAVAGLEPGIHHFGSIAHRLTPNYSARHSCPVQYGGASRRNPCGSTTSRKKTFRGTTPDQQ
jgi:hypothetical protein